MALINSFSFIVQYILKPRTVGAVLPSSKYLADKMIQGIDFDNALCIVEYGPGTGVFTEKILKNRKPDTVVFLFERNIEFYRLLSEKYSDEPKLYIINDSAENVGEYLARHGMACADYIVSGLPFASLPYEASLRILAQTKKYLKREGSFITFQYTLLKKDFIGQFFCEIAIKRELRNIPPAYVLCCRMKAEVNSGHSI
jgi:phospholipid N-methyltransferase